MGVPLCVVHAQGAWRGTSKLHLSWEPEGQRIRQCASTLHVRLSDPAGYAVVEYAWDHDGPLAGAIVLCGDPSTGEASAGWSDTWHQDKSVMPLHGKDAGSSVVLRGTYPVPGHPDWGWRIELGLSGPNVPLRMINVSPEGDEEWAVEATYERA